MTQRVTILIWNITFVLTGEIRQRTIRLKTTHSYSAANLSVPLSSSNMNIQSMLSLLMQNYNAKLRAPTFGERLINPN